MKIIIILAFISMFLVACGGSSSNTRSNTRQFNDTPVVVKINDSLIPNAGTGIKDTFFAAGGEREQRYPELTSIVDANTSTFENGFSVFGRKMRGNISGDGSLTVPNPPRDIRTAWRDGWTGKGVNVLIADNLSYDLTTSNDKHGYVVTMSANETAPNVSYYGVEVQLQKGQSYLNGGLFGEDGTTGLPVNTKIDVINMSFGTPPVSNPNLYKSSYINGRIYNDILQGNFLTNTKNAVLVKSAGNSSSNANLVYENLFLATDETTKSRILIVGALDKYAQNGNAILASYSNRAGDNEAVKRRFLVEYGGSPFGENAYLCTEDSTNLSDCSFTEFSNLRSQGTSFAAPRVAGLAALVKGKFSNLTGAQTAKILLDTATTEGLSCHPSCNSEIYGQGRVNIADALAPIGKLR